ncbi:hypothetical protein COLO4_05246 [Corchorus olitorius]|uniref:Uncharacterized protein n=1 Tax=Corchorus olitorius TaxID=93759 RepID=A0A1R3KRH4_9ROSI|nr:hypothetical protein COLO4_05246 [Corchorus olitorius]
MSGRRLLRGQETDPSQTIEIPCATVRLLPPVPSYCCIDRDQRDHREKPAAAEEEEDLGRNMGLGEGGRRRRVGRVGNQRNY